MAMVIFVANQKIRTDLLTASEAIHYSDIETDHSGVNALAHLYIGKARFLIDINPVMIGSALFSIYRNKEIPDDMPPLVIFVSTEEEKNDLIDAMLLLKMPNLEQDANINHFLKLSKYQSQIVVSPDVAESLSNYLLENDEEDLI